MTVIVVVDQGSLDFLAAHEVEVRVLDRQEATAVERRWREIYGQAFSGRPLSGSGVGATTHERKLTEVRGFPHQ